MIEDGPNHNKRDQKKPSVEPVEETLTESLSPLDCLLSEEKQLTSTSVSISQVNELVCTNEESQVRPKKLLEKLLDSTFKAPGTLICSGTSIYCYSTGQVISASMFTALTLLAISNRFLYSSRSKTENFKIRSSLYKTVTSPTIDFKFASTWMLFAAGEAFFNKSLTCIPNLLFSRGEYLAGNLEKITNKEDHKLIKMSWRDNPALYFSCGNVLVNLFSAGLKIGLIPGVAFAAISLTTGILASRDPKPPTGLTYRLLALSHLSFGVFNLFSGNPGIATAFLLWTPAAFMQGRNQDRVRETEGSS